MAFKRRFLGGGGTSTPVNPTVTGNISLVQHETVVLYLVHSINTVTSVSWNSLSFAKAAERTHSRANLQASIWVLIDVPATANSIITITFAGTPTRIAYNAYAILPTRAPLTVDKFANAQGLYPTAADADSGLTATLTYPGELILGLVAWGPPPGAGGTVTPLDGFHFAGTQTSGGATDFVSFSDSWFLREYTNVPIAAKWGNVIADWLAFVITLREADPTEDQITQIVSDLEYRDVEIHFPQVVSLLEAHDAEIHIPQVVSILEYHLGEAEEEDIFTLFF